MSSNKMSNNACYESNSENNVNSGIKSSNRCNALNNEVSSVYQNSQPVDNNTNVQQNQSNDTPLVRASYVPGSPAYGSSMYGYPGAYAGGYNPLSNIYGSGSVGYNSYSGYGGYNPYMGGGYGGMMGGYNPMMSMMGGGYGGMMGGYNPMMSMMGGYGGMMGGYNPYMSMMGGYGGMMGGYNPMMSMMGGGYGGMMGGYNPYMSMMGGGYGGMMGGGYGMGMGNNMQMTETYGPGGMTMGNSPMFAPSPGIAELAGNTSALTSAFMPLANLGSSLAMAFSGRGMMY